MKLPFREALNSMTAYASGKTIEDIQREYGLTRVDKLAANENPLNCSEKVIETVRKAAANLSIYPDSNSTELKKAIAAFYGVKETEIMPTSGSDEMINMLAGTFLNPGDETIMADFTFASYITASKMADAKIITVPVRNFALNLEGMAEAITDKTRLIWLCNPNNPTGTMFTEAELYEFMSKIPNTVVVVYDEAYAEFVTDPHYPRDSFKLYRQFPNMIVMRTFSKVYGLAGLRVGYSFAHEEVLHNINKIRSVFNVNKLAQAAAVTALTDQAFVKKVIDLNNEGKSYLYKQFEEMGIMYVPTEANYIFLDVEKDCNEVFKGMERRGIIIRPVKETFIRVTIGTMEQNKVFIKGLKEVLSE